MPISKRGRHCVCVSSRVDDGFQDLELFITFFPSWHKPLYTTPLLFLPSLPVQHDNASLCGTQTTPECCILIHTRFPVENRIMGLFTTKPKMPKVCSVGAAVVSSSQRKLELTAHHQLVHREEAGVHAPCFSPVRLRTHACVFMYCIAASQRQGGDGVVQAPNLKSHNDLLQTVASSQGRVEEWDCVDVKRWAKFIGFAKYKKEFLTIDGKVGISMMCDGVFNVLYRLSTPPCPQPLVHSVCCR